MAKVHDGVTGRLRAFIERQPVFFTATAPTGAEGHVNVSPKGMSGTFAVLSEHRVAYLDYTGSGAEGIAHLRENGRVCIMFCAFDGPPTVVRLHGTGVPVFPDDPGFGELAAHFGGTEGPAPHGLRAVIDVRVTRVSDSCGFSVPLMDYREDRDLLTRHMARRDGTAMAAYHAEKNAVSIDGLAALPIPFTPGSRTRDRDLAG